MVDALSCFFREAATRLEEEVRGSRGQGVTGGVGRQDGAALDRVAWPPTQDRVAHTVEGRLQQWEEEDRGRDGDVGAECGSRREGGCATGRKGERMSSKSPRPEQRGVSGDGLSKGGCSPSLASSIPSPGTPSSSASSPGAPPVRAFRGARPATPWGPNRSQGLQRFSSHPHLPGLLAD